MRSCRVHDVPLVGGKAGNLVGEPPAPPKGYFEAMDELFPNSKIMVMGGCFVPQAGTKNVRYCPECRNAEIRWREGREAEDYWQV